ncbi:MAG: hypothetical protein AB9835_06355 [Eubacteriales bacterium]
MSLISLFKDKSYTYGENCDVLYKKADDLKDRLIILELSLILKKTLKVGFNVITDSILFDEIEIGQGVFNIMNKTKRKYKAYVLHLEKEYNFPYLGFRYKNEIITPHMESQIENIIKKYNNIELEEILMQIEKRNDAVIKDIEYLDTINDISEQKYFFKNYAGMFDGDEMFNNINQVFDDYKLYCTGG